MRFQVTDPNLLLRYCDPVGAVVGCCQMPVELAPDQMDCHLHHTKSPYRYRSADSSLLHPVTDPNLLLRYCDPVGAVAGGCQMPVELAPAPRDLTAPRYSGSRARVDSALFPEDTLALGDAVAEEEDAGEASAATGASADCAVAAVVSADCAVVEYAAVDAVAVVAGVVAAVDAEAVVADVVADMAAPYDQEVQAAPEGLGRHHAPEGQGRHRVPEVLEGPEALVVPALAEQPG